MIKDYLDSDFNKLVKIAKAEDAISWWHNLDITTMIEVKDMFLSFDKPMGELNPFDVKIIYDRYYSNYKKKMNKWLKII